MHQPASGWDNQNRRVEFVHMSSYTVNPNRIHHIKSDLLSTIGRKFWVSQRIVRYSAYHIRKQKSCTGSIKVGEGQYKQLENVTYLKITHVEH